MLYIVIAILIFGFLIAIHELGHFMAAKASRVKVNEFSVGMGPAIFRRMVGETEWSLRLFPVGGYCAMEGEDDDSSDPRAFGNAGFWKKILILVAGAGMNFLAGVLILGEPFSIVSFIASAIAIFCVWGIQKTSAKDGPTEYVEIKDRT